MGDWNIQEVSDDDKFLAMYLSNSQTSCKSVGYSKMSYSPMVNNVQQSEKFCSSENIKERLMYLNQELTIRGFGSMYKGDNLDLAEVGNNLQQLLQSLQKGSKIQESLENRQLRLENDNERREQAFQELNENLEQCGRDLQTRKEKDRQLSVKLKQVNNKLKSEKDEVKRLNSVMHHRDVQYKHEIKKKEKEFSKLKDRLHQALADKKQDKRIGMQILNSLQRADGKRGTWKTSSRHEEEMYTLIINNYEEKQKELRVENHQLRQCLIVLQKELVDTLNGQLTQTKPINTSQNLDDTLDDFDDISLSSNTASQSVETLSEGYFQMPLDIVKEEIVKSLTDKCRMVKEHIRNLHSESQKGSVENSVKSCDTTDMKELHKDNEILKGKVDHYQRIIEQQENLIQTLSQCNSANSTLQNSILHDSGVLEEQGLLAEQKKLFYEQKTHFDEERRNFTEAAIRLAKERKHFDEDRASYLEQQFMQMTPFASLSSRPFNSNLNHSSSTSRSRRLSGSQRVGPRLLPSTPNFSPAPKNAGRDKTPSTLDLYRTIGLISDEGKENKPSSSGSVKVDNYSYIGYPRQNQQSLARNISSRTTPSNSSTLSSPASSRKKDSFRVNLFKQNGNSMLRKLSNASDN